MSKSPSKSNRGSKRDAISLPVVQAGDAKRTIRPSKSGRRRAVVLATVQLLMIAHLIQWAVTGRTLSPIEPSESMQTVQSGLINAGAIFFAIALLSTLIFGRWFCGWGCHIVMLQDGCGWILRKIGIRPRPFRSRVLMYVPFVLALYMFVWPAVYRWGIVPLSASLHRLTEVVPELSAPHPWRASSGLVTTGFWDTFPIVLVAVPFLLICGFATVYFLGNKGFCTYGCPYGGFFAPLEQFSRGRIRVTEDCEHCGHCTSVCTSNVRVHEEVREYGMVVDPGCMKCLDCVSVCPNDALHYGFGPTAAGKGAPREKERRRKWDLTIAEEIAFGAVFVLAFLSFRGVYDLIPMLMAVGMALCVTFGTWKLWRILRDENVSFHRFRLKYKGVISRSGIVFAVLVVGALGITAHCGAINTIEMAASRADDKVTIPRQFVFAAAPMVMPEEMAGQANRAIELYRLAGSVADGGIGVFTPPGSLVRRAWLEACRHDFAEAERLLRLRNARHGRTELVCIDIAVLMQLQLREAEALDYCESILAEEPDYVVLLDEYVLQLVSDGRPADAIAACRAALDRVGDQERALYVMRRLSLLLVDHGDLDEGIAIFERTIEIDDRNPASFVLLARAYALRGEGDRAVETMERALSLAPESADVARDMAILLDGLGRGDEAARYRERAKALGG